MTDKRSLGSDEAGDLEEVRAAVRGALDTDAFRGMVAQQFEPLVESVANGLSKVSLHFDLAESRQAVGDALGIEVNAELAGRTRTAIHDEIGNALRREFNQAYNRHGPLS
ncbi:hypothetical protein [Mycolicibacterium fluoranthenivorans]|uniref:Uncharacterized protein n=1 Tax=Mycolicibacterium fluoranthenivorans TaxID=258505 RepID=A0A7X5ZE97_9MYCO|nr:hypothetical protein [Mycolicibacterium fluoranthenivorans]MCV7359546.1 hypothetical protein [Mycolicibacterium fluoranthenivorans]NIH96926.1 hypothetical protein [Mycolicibacterium fluoranthenivorans]